MRGRGKVRVAVLLLVSLLCGVIQVDGSSEAKTRVSMRQEAVSEESGLPSATASPIASAIPSASANPIVSASPIASVEPSASVVPENTTEPTATPEVSEQPVTESPMPRELTLLNDEARSGAQGQKGIHYGRVKGGKFYHITTFITDEIKLKLNHKATYKVVGAKNKKEFKKKVIRVSKQGVIKCSNKKKGIHEYAVIKVTSKDSGEVIYVYLHFLPKLYSKTAKKQSIIIGKKINLKFNYGKKKLSFGSSAPKVATVNKKGVVHACKKGIAVITVRVKGSAKNMVRIRIIVKEEPWIVSAKDTCYTYSDMTSDLHQLSAKYGSKASLFSIGKSYDDRQLWCIRLGNPNASKKVVIDGGIHAREWLNCQLLTRKVEDILRRYSEFKDSLRTVCVYVLPMLNPDGVSISQSGFSSLRSAKLRKICKKTKCPAKTWKANGRGVNLNNNFPAGWKIMKKKSKQKKPHGSAFNGKSAGSELETRAIMQFIQNMSGLRAVLNFHSTGQVLYWKYSVESNPDQWARQKQLAYKIHEFNHYTLMPKGSGKNKAAGMGDWLAYNQKVPTVTVETGVAAAPMPHGEYSRIERQNTKMIDWFIRSYP